MTKNLVSLEEIRAELSNASVEEVEARRHLDALAWWLSEHERKTRVLA